MSGSIFTQKYFPCNVQCLYMSAHIRHYYIMWAIKSHTVKDKTLAGFSLENCLQIRLVKKKIIDEFIAQSIMNNIKVANWQIKVWKISLISQICLSKVLPRFHLSRYSSHFSKQ